MPMHRPDTKNFYQRYFHVILLQIVAVALIFPGATHAAPRPSRVSERMTFKYPSLQPANDIHFKIWQKEDDVEVLKCNIDSKELPNPIHKPGDQPDYAPLGLKNPHRTIEVLHPENKNKVVADNRKHAIDVDASRKEDFKKDEKITFDFEWTLTEWNTKRMGSGFWTKDGKPNGIKIPDNGWTISNYRRVDSLPRLFDLSSNAAWLHPFTLFNDDPTESFVVHGLKFSPQLGFPDLDSLDSLTWSTPLPDFLLTPGQSYSMDVESLFEAGSIAGYYELMNAATGSQFMTDYFVHEVPIPEPGSIILLGSGLVALIGVAHRIRGKV